MASIASLQSAYDWDYNIGDLLDLDMGLTETSFQEVRHNHPTLFGIRSLSQLSKSKEFLRTAISTYKEASSGLRAAGRFTTEQDWVDGTEPDFLFVLDQYDFADEQQFIDDLNELLGALDNDYVITDGEFPGTVVSLSAFFDGGLNLPVLLPSSIEVNFPQMNLQIQPLVAFCPMQPMLPQSFYRK